MLGTRVLSSIVILPPVIAAVWFGDYYFVALIALVGTVMAWEISGLAGLTATPARYAIATLGALTPIVAVELPWGFVIVWPVFAVAALLAISWGYLKDFAERLGFFTLSFLAFASLGSLIWLRFSDLGDHGAALVLYLVLVITATDVGAYFSGRWIGGAKLAPKISPGTKCPMACRPPVGKGGWAFNRQPSGARTCTGRVAPSLFGNVGMVMHLIA